MKKEIYYLTLSWLNISHSFHVGDILSKKQDTCNILLFLKEISGARNEIILKNTNGISSWASWKLQMKQRAYIL